MITLDEVIERERKQAEMYRCEYESECDYYGKDFIDDYADKLDCIKNMHEHEQLAEWLEELKVYQQHEIICSKGYNAVYNKAIDDFVKFANTMPTVEEEDGEIRPMRLEEMAEHLKAGGEK